MAPLASRSACTSKPGLRRGHRSWPAGDAGGAARRLGWGDHSHLAGSRLSLPPPGLHGALGAEARGRLTHNALGALRPRAAEQRGRGRARGGTQGRGCNRGLLWPRPSPHARAGRGGRPPRHDRRRDRRRNQSPERRLTAPPCCPSSLPQSPALGPKPPETPSSRGKLAPPAFPPRRPCRPGPVCRTAVSLAVTASRCCPESNSKSFRGKGPRHLHHHLPS